MRKEIKIAGFGGQGVGLAGFILGQAFALYEDLEAVMTQSYGPEARGGASSASIVVSDQEIAYPFVQHPDVLIVFSQEAYNRFQPAVKTSGLILLDDGLVDPLEESYYLGIPATFIAEELGKRLVANMVMLGFFCARTELVSRNALERSIASTVKPNTRRLNLSAFDAGYQYDLQGIRTR